MAKVNPLFILIVVLVVALVTLLLSSSNIVPYDNNTRYATYEPMTEMAKQSKESESIQDTTKEKKDANKGVGSSILSSVSGIFGTENFEPMVDEPKTVQYGPFRDSEIIDRFSQVTANGTDGVDGCVSSGLSNSGGYICLTPDLIKMLKSRGGNATGN